MAPAAPLRQPTARTSASTLRGYRTSLGSVGKRGRAYNSLMLSLKLEFFLYEGLRLSTVQHAFLSIAFQVLTQFAQSIAAARPAPLGRVGETDSPAPCGCPFPFPHTFTPAQVRPHTRTGAHLHSFTPSHIRPHTITSAHPHNCDAALLFCAFYLLTGAYLHTFTAAHLCVCGLTTTHLHTYSPVRVHNSLTSAFRVRTMPS